MGKKYYEIMVVFDGRWKVDFNGQKYGPFPSEDAAMEAATGAASRAATLGAETLVSVSRL